MGNMNDEISPDDSLRIVESARFNSTFSPTGLVKIIYHRDGQEDIIETTNLVVNSGKQVLSKLLGNTDTGRYVDRMGLGTGGANTNTLYTPIAPTATDTALAIEVATGTYSRVAVSPTFPSTLSVRFSALFNSNSVNQNVNEAALFFNVKSGESVAILFARVTFPTRYMMADAAATMEVSWTIQIG